MDDIPRALVRERQADLRRRALRHQIRDDRRRRLRHEGRPAGRSPLGLSRELWLVEVGIFLNMLGYGAVLPFEIIYLHDERGFPLGIAGLVVGTLTGVAVVVAPLVGPLIDRYGARASTVAAGLALAAGYAGLAFAATVPIAFAAAVLAGVGNGALNPSQSTLLATLARADVRHRVTAVSRVAANAGIGLGSALGGLVAVYGLAGFVALFLANAATYLVFVGVLAAVVREGARPEPVAGGYRLVLRDTTFVRLAAINVAMIGVGWGVFTWLMPPYARSVVGVSAPLIGVLLLANAVTVVVAQIPVARLAEGRRRMATVAVGALIFTGACLLVAAAKNEAAAAYPLMLLASVAVGAGECFHTTVLMPLVADLAPAGLRGRYLASMGFSWWIGLAIAPTAGASLLARAPTAVFLFSAAVALTAGVAALGLERRLPPTARRTPRLADPSRQPRARRAPLPEDGGRPG